MDRARFLAYVTFKPLIQASPFTEDICSRGQLAERKVSAEVHFPSPGCLIRIPFVCSLSQSPHAPNTCILHGMLILPQSLPNHNPISTYLM